VIEIRSYRRVFDLERRIYRVDRFRLNPGGVPLRGLVYMSANVAALTVLARIPVIGWPLAALPWYLLYVALPLTTSTLLAVVQVEGRPFHLAALPLIGARHARWLRSRTRCVAAWHPPPMVVLADGSDNDMRALRYRGPGIALVAIAHQRATAWAGQSSCSSPHPTLHACVAAR
jgi:hypothetical protein